MASTVSENEIRQVIEQVKHPAIDRTLVELGIIKDKTFEGNKVILTFAFPFPNVPIKDYLINSVKRPLEELGLEVEVNTTIMNQEERQRFLALEQESWKGL